MLCDNTVLKAEYFIKTNNFLFSKRIINLIRADVKRCYKSHLYCQLLFLVCSLLTDTGETKLKLRSHAMRNGYGRHSGTSKEYKIKC